MSPSDKYYDHDPLWSALERQQDPFWGPYSRRLYDRLIATLGQCGIETDGLAVDVGCGAGAFGLWLEQAGYRYIGLDASNVAIELGRRKFPHLTLRHLDLATDPLCLPQGEEARLVSAVNSLHCLVGSEERRLFLRHMRAMLKPGGHLLLTTMHGPVEVPFRPSKRPRSYLPAEAIIDELLAAGFGPLVYEEREPANELGRVPNLIVVAGAASSWA